MSGAQIAHAAGAPAIVWFRRDLRLDDHPALHAAIATGRPVCAVYILDEDAARPWSMGAASRWRLHRSLFSLAAAIAERGGSLVLRRGKSGREILRLAAETEAAEVFWCRDVTPHGVMLDGKLRHALRERAVGAHCMHGDLLHAPEDVSPKAGGFFKVFTPFWRACLERSFVRPVGAIDGRWPAFPVQPPSDTLADWRLEPSRPNWAKLFEPGLDQGAAAAEALLQTFLADRVATYGKARDRPDLAGTSQLSSHLAFGEISVRAIAAELQLRAHAEPNYRAPLDKFLSELGWREFARHMLLHVPTLPDAPLRTPFERVAWRNDPQGLEAWRRGRTGFPIVDAGMRQLWETGWMHNRVRMIVGSFLVKDLLIDWREGQRWFWDTLVDADLASNAFNWQWIAGCGADAAPYFRIFNPTKQGQAWDPNGDYVRRWVPELAHLPAAQIHAPTGVKGYPAPILDHAAARKRALAAYALATEPA